MTDRVKHSCEDCALRRRAEARPRSFLGILWKLHTYVCPGWRRYRRATAPRAEHARPSTD
jgi:hypothetical protein